MIGLPFLPIVRFAVSNVLLTSKILTLSPLTGDPGKVIVNAPPDWNVDPSGSPWNWGIRTQRLFDRVHAHATDAGGDLKFFCRNSHGELTDVLTKDATDSIKKVVQLQLFLARLKWNGSATLRLQAILKRVIHVNHPKLRRHNSQPQPKHYYRSASLQKTHSRTNCIIT